MKIFKSLLILAIALFIMGCPNGGGNTNSSCVNQESLGQETTCLAVTVLEQGNPFPNPVSGGGTVNLSMKIGAVDSSFNPLSATISTKVFNLQGQLVTQQTAGTVASSANYQDVPIWTNINVASGLYYVEVTIDVGACGSKTICLSDKRIEVIK